MANHRTTWAEITMFPWLCKKFQPSNRRGSPKETNTRGAMAFFLQDCVRQDPDHREWNEVNVFPSLTSVYIYIYIYICICMYMYIRRHLYGLSEHMVHMLRYSYWFIMPIISLLVGHIPHIVGYIYILYTVCRYIYIHIYILYCITMLIMLYPHSYWTCTRFRHTQTSYTSCTNVPHYIPM
jgi:hypothetical protein